MSVTLEDATKTPMRMVVSNKPHKPLSNAEKEWFEKLSEELLHYSPVTKTYCGKRTSPPRRRKTTSKKNSP